MEQPLTNPGSGLRKITRTRIVLAFVVAVVADGLQLLLGMFGWVVVDAIIDVIAMVLVTWLIGFHWLFLPTFVIEAVPVIDDFPSWTACVAAVTALRRRPSTIPGVPSEKPPIEP